MSTLAPEGLSLLRQPVPAENIGKLPRVTCRDCSKNSCNDKTHRKEKCRECGAYVSNKHIHLDYVGHAETTDRLLEADLEWAWEPFALDDDGLPKFDQFGGLWIRMTVCGVTRVGYGSAENGGFKAKGDLVKEVIGDAIRNAAMRFGVALNLWAKTELHAAEHEEPEQEAPKPRARKAAGTLQRSRPAEPAGEWTGEDEPLAEQRVPASMPQLNMLNTLISKKYGNLPREKRLAFVAELAGRKLGSSKDLTKDEASGIIERLNTRSDYVPEEQREAAAQAEAVQLAASDASPVEAAVDDLRDALESAGSVEQLATEWGRVEAAQSAGVVDGVAVGMLRQVATRREDALTADSGWSRGISRQMDAAA